MDLKAYFDETKGTGILATADATGKVDAAVYSRPHVMEDGQIAFIMTDRLTHANLQSNPHAVYLFMEEDKRWQGKRLYLSRTKEETDEEKIQSLMRRRNSPDSEKYKEIRKFLVYFKLDKELPLIGEGE